MSRTMLWTRCIVTVRHLLRIPPVSSVMPGQVGSILSGHYGRTVRTTDNGVPANSTINCWTCHDDGDHSGGDHILGDGNGDVWNDVIAALSESTIPAITAMRAVLRGMPR